MDKILDKTDIRIATCFSSVVINQAVSINYDRLELIDNMMFIWKNNNIISSIIFIPQNKYRFEIVTKNGFEYFNVYEDAKEYLIKNNLVK